jgi:hypothetical protein
VLAAIGWDRVVGKTPNDVLVKVLDAFAQKVKLVEATPPGGGDKEKGSDGFVDERPSTRITPVPAAPGAVADFAEPSLANATLQAKMSGPPPIVNNAKTSVPPASEDERAVDALFSESQMPPGEEAEQMIVVEEYEDTQTGTAVPAAVAAKPEEKDDNPTNRPPPSIPAEPMLLKPRQTAPPSKAPVRR